jgi:hypothetical protein
MVMRKTTNPASSVSIAAFAGAGGMLLLEVVLFTLFFLPVFLISLPFLFAFRFSNKSR